MQMALSNGLRAALIHQRGGQLAQAEAIYRQILQRLPNQADALHLLGALILRQGDTAEAVPFIQRAIRANPNNFEAHANLAFALHERGELDQAREHYRKALTLKPDYADAWFNQHAALIDATDLLPAITSLQRTVALNPNDRDARYMLGVLLERNGDAQGASTYLDPLADGDATDHARLEAWRYLKSQGGLQLPVTGSMIDTFRLAIAAAPKEGLVLEFGVRFGNTIRQIALLAKQPVHGFDSFEGLPESWHAEARGSYSTGGRLPEVPASVTLHKGWFDQTLPVFLAQHAGPVRFVNIDCDLYSSTKTVLDLLAPRMVCGSVLVFDEYIGNAQWREDEFKAFQEAVECYGWEYEYLCYSLFTKQVAVRLNKV